MTCFGKNTAKKGKRNHRQQYHCKDCKRHFMEIPLIRRMNPDRDAYLVRMHREGNGTRGIARMMDISHTTVMKTKLRLAAKVPEPWLEPGRVYQVDELATFIAWRKRPRPRKGKKRKKDEWYVAHAIDAKTGRHVGFVCGKRTKKNLRILVDRLLGTNPKRIHTDGLNIYPTLIPKAIHSVYAKCTNRIERLNLTMRTHIRRLNRKTLCFSRKRLMLEADIRLYFSSYI
jgi:insertion element IS1 protein InsB